MIIQREGHTAGGSLKEGISAASSTRIVTMKFFQLTLALSALVWFSTVLVAQEPLDYRTAFKNAQAGEKPLLVLVTAEWCPPCVLMKQTTIPTLIKKEAFKDFNYATVDLDKEEKLARQLIGDRGVPQLIMYEKQGDQWVRRFLSGYQSTDKVEIFMAQVGKVKIAEIASTGSKTK
jgi:thiol:disulfide interchange protein